MKKKIKIKVFVILYLIIFLPKVLCAATNYVNIVSSNPTYPYTNWVTAATNIQAAVDAGSVGNTVLVTNGTYSGFCRTQYGSNVVTVSKGLTVMSVNGASHTIVDGQGMYRAFYITNNVILNGFTISNSFATHWMPNGYGGGVLMDHGGKIENSIITCNSAWNGGGIACLYGGTIQNCTISKNIATNENGGGGVMCHYGGTLRNCLIIDNQCIGYLDESVKISGKGGGVTCYLGGSIENCTICNNYATFHGGGVYTRSSISYGKKYIPSLVNSIIYFNTTDLYGSNCYNSTSGGAKPLYEFCNTAPIPDGAGNASWNPLFVNRLINNYHLSQGSYCINTGINSTWMESTTDIDGIPRIMYDLVDMGTYEYVAEALCCGFAANIPNTNINVTISQDILFWSSLGGSNTNDVYYWWDFDNNGVFDKEGTASTSTWNYLFAGSYSVLLMTSNSVGEVAQSLRNNYINVIPEPLSASILIAMIMGILLKIRITN